MEWDQDASGEVKMGHGENLLHREVVVPWKRLPREVVTHKPVRVQGGPGQYSHCMVYFQVVLQGAGSCSQ